jgi:hypothetical protein
MRYSRSLLLILGKERRRQMQNNYDNAEIREIGKAQDVILGGKSDELPLDSDTDLRWVPGSDEDE